MAKRKPRGVSSTDWSTALIRKAEEEGAFDNLSTSGKPIADLDKPYDQLWWAKKLMKRENIEFLPDSLKLRREVESRLEKIHRMKAEETVRLEIDSLNQHIRKVNSQAIEGPPSDVSPLDPDEIVRRWRKKRDQSS